MLDAIGGRNSDFDAPVLWVVRVLADCFVCGNAQCAGPGKSQGLGLEAARWPARPRDAAPSLGRRSDFLCVLRQLNRLARPFSLISPTGAGARSDHSAAYLRSCLPDFLLRNLR